MTEKVILVFKTHFDIGFTDLAEKVLAWYSGPMLDEVLKTCAETADMGDQAFVWTMPAMPLYEMLRRNSGAKYEELTGLIRDRRIVWHALPFTSHTDFCGVEEMIRSFAWSDQLSRMFGLPRPVTAKMSDVPGHGRILPTILSRTGVRFLHLGCNEFAMSPDLPPLFFWEGPDGSRVLTMYSPGGYGAAKPPAGWDYPVWISFQHTHDNLGPQTAESLRAIVRETEAGAPGAKVICGTLEDFYRELIRYDLSRVPVITTDLADSWIHGVGSYPAEVAEVRTARNQVMELEAVLALLEAGREEERDLIAGIYEQLSRFGEHTWGLDVKTWLPAGLRVYEKEAFLQAKQTGPYRYMETSWDEQKQHAAAAGRLLGQLAGEVNGQLADRSQSGSVTVVNANGSSFTGWAGNCTDDGNGMELFGRRYLFVDGAPALSVSPLSEDSGYMKTRMTVTEQKGRIVAENHRYRITVCAGSGKVEAVYDRRLRQNILAARGPEGVFGYRYDKYGSGRVEQFLSDYCQIPSDWGIKDNGREAYPAGQDELFYPLFTGYAICEDALILSYQGQGADRYGDAGKIRLILTLPPAGDEFFVELALTGKEESPYIESGSLTFPFAGDRASYRFNKNGGLIDPESDIADRANHVLYCLEAFAAMSGGDAGVGIVAHDTPLTAIGETGIYTFREQYELHEPVLYFNLFNNMWGTNFPQWTGGDLSFRYTVFGYRAGEPVLERGLKLYRGAAITALPAAESPFILPPEVEILALIPDPSGCILRLHDLSGRSRSFELVCRKPGGGLQECDLTGQALTGIQVGCLQMETASYDIRTIRYIRPEMMGGRI